MTCMGTNASVQLLCGTTAPTGLPVVIDAKFKTLNPSHSQGGENHAFPRKPFSDYNTSSARVEPNAGTGQGRLHCSSP